MNNTIGNKDAFLSLYEHPGIVGQALYANFFFTVRAMMGKGRMHEIGCGAGFSVVHLKRNGYSASDFDPELVELAQKKNPDVNIFEESAYELETPEVPYDTSLSLEVLEHLEQPEKALMEMRRVTKTGGTIIVSVPNEPIWRIANFLRGKYMNNLGNTPGHINHWAPGDLKKMVAKYFTVEEVRYPFPWIVIKARV